MQIQLQNLIKVALLLGAITTAQAANLSFTGSFLQDDDVQLFNFTVNSTSDVTLRSWSYAGGVNANGQTIARGGFDPILALFNSAGNQIGQNDDAGCGLVAADPATGRCWDVLLTSNLTPGTYTVSVMQYDNFSKGASLSEGFSRQGEGNFTSSFSGGPASGGSFRDISGTDGAQRDSHWAFDILNVQSAEQVGGGDGIGGDVPPGVPEPSTMALVPGALLALGYLARRRMS